MAIKKNYINVPTLDNADEASFTIIDGREGNITEQDLYPNKVETIENTLIKITNDGYIDGTRWAEKNGYSYDGSNDITKIVDNKAYDHDTFLFNIATNTIKYASPEELDYDSIRTEGGTGDPSLGMFGYTDIESFESDLSSLIRGNKMFQHSKIKVFNGDLGNLKYGIRMFASSPLSTFNSNLSSLVNGSFMFSANKLQFFAIPLPSLTGGAYMFNSCENLKLIETNLSNLINGEKMFYKCSKLEKISSQLSSLTAGESMFEGCILLDNFLSDCQSLIDGRRMFYNCERFTNFKSSLYSLKSGFNMFKGAKLTPASVKNIAETINDITDLNRNNSADWRHPLEGSIPPNDRGVIHIDTDRTEEELVKNYCTQIMERGWIVYLNGVLIEPVQVPTLDSFWDFRWSRRNNFNSKQSTSDSTTVSFDSFKDDTIFDIDGNAIYSVSPSTSTIVDISPAAMEVTLTNELPDVANPQTGVHYYSMINSSTYQVWSWDGNQWIKVTQIPGSERDNGAFSFTDMVAFDSNLRQLENGTNMFRYCYDLESVSGDFTNLKVGNYMFNNCQKFISFNNVTFPRLKYAEGMFGKCSSFGKDNSVNGGITNLGQLQVGYRVFHTTALKQWDLDMPSLENSMLMFEYCEQLESFAGDLSNLVYAQTMFQNCHKLKTFKGKLSSLLNGGSMFCGWRNTDTKYICPLTPESIKYIADTINDISEKDKNDSAQWQYLTHDTKTYGTIHKNNRGLLDLGWNNIEFASQEATVLNDCRRIVKKGWNVYLNGQRITGEPWTDPEVPEGEYENLSTGVAYDTLYSANIKAQSLLTGATVEKTITSVNGNMVYTSGNAYKMEPALESVTDISAASGTGMFSYTALTSFTSYLTQLTNSKSMFNNCLNLQSFTGYLNSVEYAKEMFKNCSKLVNLHLESGLNALKDGQSMFENTNLSNFNYNLPALVDGRSMFKGSNNLTGFTGTLDSLLSATDMFIDTNLSLASIESIATNIQNISAKDKNDSTLWQAPDGSYFDSSDRGRIDISYNNTNDSSFEAYCQMIISKGWDIYVNGSKIDIEKPIDAEVWIKVNYQGEIYEANLDNLYYGASFFENRTPYYLFHGAQENNMNSNSRITEMPSLVFGRYMFADAMLFRFKCNMPELTDGYHMFYSTPSLEIFEGDLSKLVDARGMFKDSTILTSFKTNSLSNLKQADDMFKNCQLDLDSIKNILENYLPTFTDGSTHNIHLGVQNSEEIKYYITDILKIIPSNITKRAQYKGWTVYITTTN